MVNDNLYPIGTIFRMNDSEFIILGYEQSIVGDSLIGCYAVAGYPIGFTAFEDVCLISTESVEEIVFCGYQDDGIYPTFIQQKSELFEACAKVNIDDLQHALDMIEQNLKMEEKIDE